MKKFIILFFIFSCSLFCRESIFDKVEWIKVDEKKGVLLFMQKDKNEKINFYKAEKEFNITFCEDFFNNLLDFEKYPQIFPRTILFKKIKDISKGRYLVYSQISFAPIKNRDYYILTEESYVENNNIKEHVLEWYPADIINDDFIVNKDFVRVKNVYGRWKVSAGKDKIKVSVEYYNDFCLNISNKITSYFEKDSTIDALLGLEGYTLGKK